MERTKRNAAWNACSLAIRASASSATRMRATAKRSGSRKSTALSGPWIDYGVRWIGVRHTVRSLLSLSLICVAAWAQESRPVVPLWPNGAPGSEGKTAAESVRIAAPGGDHIVSSVHNPSITVYLPKANASGAAVVIAPGGGHSELWVDHEGYNVAEWLSDHGVAGVVLKYRLAREKGSTYTVEGDALADTQRALRVVRSRAAEWGVDPERIGVMGFSAGGELAALAGSRYGDAPAAGDDISRLSDKPAFQA